VESLKFRIMLSFIRTSEGLLDLASASSFRSNNFAPLYICFDTSHLSAWFSH
jgi:hypothetical protein